jgi:predicted class III extradiol MEMO1 family dioxygenase
LDGNTGDEEYAHTREHSLEFAAVLLRSVWTSPSEPSAVFILLGNLFGEDGVDSGRLNEMNRLSDAIRALRQTHRQRGKSVMVIAAADLSHVGARFGGKAIIPGSDLSRLEAADKTELGILIDDGAEAFLGKCSEHRNERNVCGIPALYVARRAEDTTGGFIAAYEQSREVETSSVVTVATLWMD